jgi:hypothetical protein
MHPRLLNPRITSLASLRSPNHQSNVSNRVFIFITLCLQSLFLFPSRDLLFSGSFEPDDDDEILGGCD